MRHLGIVLVLIGLPALAAAQDPAPASIGSIGLPLPSIGLPLPSIGLAPWTLGLSPVPGGVGQPAPEFLPGNRRHPGGRHHPRPSTVYFVPSFGFGGGPYVQTATPQATPVAVSKPETGSLRLEVEPSQALQVLVDGVFVGTPRDLGHEVELKPGSRRVEFRAPGYVPLIVDVRIVPGQSVTYRGTLNPIARAEPPPPVSPPPMVAPTGSTTLYVIPGCYLGNVRPEEARLPEGCDLSRLSIRTP